MPGKHVFEYAIYPHPGDWREGNVSRQAELFSSGIYTAMSGPHRGNLLWEAGFLEIEPAELVLTAVKLAEAGERLILRFYNISNQPVDARIGFNKPLKAVALTNLKEEPVKQLDIRNNNIYFNVSPHRIITITTEFGDAGKI